jgi:hypothetical protein
MIVTNDLKRTFNEYSTDNSDLENNFIPRKGGKINFTLKNCMLINHKLENGQLLIYFQKISNETKF